MAEVQASIRSALEKAAQQYNGASVVKIVQALDAVGFVCDQEDVRGGFQELEGWALMQPPLNLNAQEACVVIAAQRTVSPGLCH